MIRAVIVDDERNNIDTIAGMLLKYNMPVNIVGVATNADEGIEQILATILKM